MIWQNTKVRIAIIASLVLLAIIAYRIYGNIQANNERANRVSQGQNIAVATSFPQRQSITPVMRFAGSLDPVWQADVAAKIDGRVEKRFMLMKVTRSQLALCWLIWNRQNRRLICYRRRVL